MSTISIIIPSYRQPHLLARAIESCLEQDHQDLEVIVVDDHSRDASLGVAVSYAAVDDRVRVVEALENGGLGRTRNIGLSHAAGEFVCFLDADDYLLPGSLSSRLAAFPAAQQAYGDALVAVYGDWQHVSEAVDHPKVREARAEMPVVSPATYTGENAFICSAPLVRRDAVIAAGGFPEGLPMLEDFALWAKMIASGAVFAPVSHVVATYRQRPNSMLRGDGVAVMADYVEAINSWMAAHEVLLHDGGALDAWLSGAPPYSFGRMSWDVPSPPGYFSEETDLSERREQLMERANAALPDFMNERDMIGLANPAPTLALRCEDVPEVGLLVHSLEESLAACGLCELLAGEGRSCAVYCVDPSDWPALWPLALVGIAAQPLSDLPEGVDIVDFSKADHRFAEMLPPASDVVNRLVVEQPRSGAIVYVGTALAGYPALDGWISVTATAAARCDLEVTLMADPEMLEDTQGWRATPLTFQAAKAAQLVIAPPGAHSELFAQLAPTVVFMPGIADDSVARTVGELRSAIERQLG